jgi:hypothetical protein
MCSLWAVTPKEWKGKQNLISLSDLLIDYSTVLLLARGIKEQVAQSI